MTQSIPCPNPAQCYTKTKTHISHSAVAECAAIAARSKRSSPLASGLPTGVAGRSPAREELDSKMEFNIPCVVTADGTVEDAPSSIQAPDYHEGEMMGGEKEWEAITGFSGQHGYGGAVMHTDEYIGGGLEDYIWDNPGTYVVVEATVDPNPEDDPDEYENDESVTAGWVLLRRKETVEAKGASTAVEWGDDEFDRGPSPKTVGTVAHVVDNFGERGLYQLSRFEVEDPKYPNQSTAVWVDVNDPSREVRDHEIDQWKPESFPDTKAGELESEYRNAMHHLSREQRAADAEQDAMLSEMGLLDEGQRLTTALGSGRAPVTALYGSNRDGTRGFGVVVRRDPETGEAKVLSDGDTGSQRAQNVIDYMTKNADRVVAWRERNASLESVRDRAREVGGQYRDVSGGKSL